MGHFVAHHTERDRGIVTRSTREWFATARYHLPRFGTGNNQPFDLSRLPFAAQEYYKIAVNRIDMKTIREQTGLTKLKAHAVMLDLAKRLQRNADGTWSVPPVLTQTELNLIKCVSEHMVVRRGVRT